MRSTSRTVLASLAAGALLLSACTGDEEAAFKACQVTDTGDIDDKSFNETAWNGFLRAEEDFDLEVKYLLSETAADYEPNIQAFLDEGCDLIVTVGFLLGDATAAAVAANPEQAFGIIDVNYLDPSDNLLMIDFQTDQAAFLAGYVAASATESGKVGTWGGIALPSVTIFMDGFLAGVNYHNAQKGTSVEVLGWDGTDGQFINDFTSADLGNAVTASMLQEGADIILPVAGPAGLGTGTAIRDFGSGRMIWVDSDGYFSTPNFSDIILTSVLKRIDNATYDAAASVVDGSFTGGTYIGTLENGGVGIAPFHDFEDAVSDEVKSELEAITAAIIAGDIQTTP